MEALINNSSKWIYSISCESVLMRDVLLYHYPMYHYYRCTKVQFPLTDFQQLLDQITMFTTLFDGEQVKHARATCTTFVCVVRVLLIHCLIHLCVQYTTTYHIVNLMWKTVNTLVEIPFLLEVLCVILTSRGVRKHS